MPASSAATSHKSLRLFTTSHELDLLNSLSHDPSTPLTGRRDSDASTSPHAITHSPTVSSQMAERLERSHTEIEQLRTRVAHLEAQLESEQQRARDELRDACQSLWARFERELAQERERSQAAMLALLESHPRPTI